MNSVLRHLCLAVCAIVLLRGEKNLLPILARRYREALKLAKSSSNPLISCIADDLDVQPFAYLEGQVRPLDEKIHICFHFDWLMLFDVPLFRWCLFLCMERAFSRCGKGCADDQSWQDYSPSSRTIACHECSRFGNTQGRIG